MTTQQQMLEAFAPEFVGDTRLSLALTLAAEQMGSEAIWGNVYDQAVAYLAAHLLTGWSPTAGSGTGTGAGGTAGPVTDERAGDVSRSYGNALTGVSGVNLTDALLATTTHGRNYLALRRTRSAGAPGLAQSGTRYALGRTRSC